MRARLFGRWVGRAAVFAVLGFGALVAGGVASASAYVNQTEISQPGAGISEAVVEVVPIAYGFEWT